MLQSCPPLCDPMDCSRPRSSVRGDSPRQEYWSGLPCPPPGVQRIFFMAAFCKDHSARSILLYKNSYYVLPSKACICATTGTWDFYYI